MKCPFKKITTNYDCNDSKMGSGMMSSNKPIAVVRETFGECDKSHCPAYQPSEKIPCRLCVRNK